MTEEKMMGVRGIPEDLRRKFIASCHINGVAAGEVLRKVFAELGDPERLRDYMADEGEEEDE